MKMLEWRSGGRGKQVLVHLKMREGHLTFANRFGETFDAEEFLLGPNQYTWKRRYNRKLTRLLQQMSLRNPALFAEMCKQWNGQYRLCSLADEGVKCSYHHPDHYTVDGVEFVVSDVAPCCTTVEYNMIKLIL